jgi:hypothetical protein
MLDLPHTEDFCNRCKRYGLVYAFSPADANYEWLCEKCINDLEGVKNADKDTGPQSGFRRNDSKGDTEQQLFETT